MYGVLSRAEYGIDEKSIVMGRGADGKKTGEATGDPAEYLRRRQSDASQCLQRPMSSCPPLRLQKRLSRPTVLLHSQRQRCTQHVHSAVSTSNSLWRRSRSRRYTAGTSSSSGLAFGHPLKFAMYVAGINQ